MVTRREFLVSAGLGAAALALGGVSQPPEAFLIPLGVGDDRAWYAVDGRTALSVNGEPATVADVLALDWSRGGFPAIYRGTHGDDLTVTPLPGGWGCGTAREVPRLEVLDLLVPEGRG